MKLFNFLAVFFGGALGASLRYALELLSAHFFSWSSTLTIAVVNVMGCFLFALVSSMFSSQMSSTLTLFLLTGFLGGMTTFSSFIAHSHDLLSIKQVVWAAINISAQICLGLLAFYCTKKIVMQRMTKIKNLGPKSLAVLAQLKLDDIHIVKELGWKNVMLQIAQHNSNFINANMAYALIGAIQNKHWLSVSQEEKKEVQQFIHHLKIKK